MDIKKLSAYELIEKRELEDICAAGYLLRHKKSGARLFLVENKDENKVFNIAFRTPAPDSTGVPHILEHSVLCGSRKFPAKDPFVELVKGSLNTFLNAMTYPDKTMYPVASCNDKDFQNLMDVYMDAVFHTNIYKKEEIFRQEGWSYSLEDVDGELTYNGVVYNEMKGAFSSPESVLNREILAALYPDTNYANESGGNPEVIPELTYEKFLEFHSRYYHPSNSYIYLYGNMDMEEKLAWLDQEYLSEYDFCPVQSEIPVQKPFAQVRVVKKEYSITEGENEQDNTYLSYNISIGDSLDSRLNLAGQILEYVLISAPGAPLKKALLDAGIGKDVYGSFEVDAKQSFFSVVAKNTNEDKKDEFALVIRNTLSELTKKGLEREALESAINYLEFRYREADFGRYPKGLMYGLQVFASWIYDENNPFMNLELSRDFEFLKKNLDTGYFEGLINRYILNNTHGAFVIIKPQKGLTSRKEEALHHKLQAYKETLTENEKKELVEKTLALRAYQDAPPTREEQESIPLLERKDIEPKAAPFIYDEKEADGIKILHHNLHTNGIGYLTLVFSADYVPLKLLPYLGLLKAVLGYVDTKNYSYGKLFHEINRQTGGIQLGITVYGDYKNSEIPGRVTFQVSAKAFYDKQDFVFQMIHEILMNSQLTDDKRLYEIISEIRSRMQMNISSSGHATALTRGLSYISLIQYYSEVTSGVYFYKFIEDLEKNFESRAKELKNNLRETMALIFRRENLLVSYTSEEAGYEQIPGLVTDLSKALYQNEIVKTRELPVLEKKNEGFKTSSQVQYVARVGNFKKAGYEYNGCLKILSVIMNYEYLWINIRVKGGAYGCMSGFSRNGDSYFVSYRDPNLEKTDVVFEGVPEFVENFTVDERDMTKYVIGTISDIDQPLTAKAKGSRALTAYIMGVTQEMVQKERDEILSADQESIRRLTPLLKSIIGEQVICALGNEEKIEASSLFKNKVNLFA